MSSSENKTPISKSEAINQFSRTKIHAANISKTPAWCQDKLLHWLLEGNLQNFNDLIKSKIIKMNYFYAAPYNGTLLDIACRTRATGEFVKVILQNYVHIVYVNVINKITGKAAIHEAIENSTVDVVDVLIQHYCDIDLEDRCGNTPLHSAIKRNDLQIIKLLLENNYGERIDINRSNRHNPTPLHIALLEGYTEAAILLLKYPHVDLDFQTDSEGRTCRQIIQQRYPTLNEKTMKKSITDGENPAKILLSLLKRGETEKFIELASKMSTEFLEDNLQSSCQECCTFLEYACLRGHGYADVVDTLLAKGVNPNVTDKGSAPILHAAKNGYYDIFLKLLNHPRIELHIGEAGTPLHSIIYGMSLPYKSNDRQRLQCLELLLNKVIPQGRLDIDYMDRKGRTALHRAVLFNDEHLIKSLIYTGAHLYLKNSKGKVPLTSIKANILEDYLDDCISSEIDSVYTRNIEIIFDYTVFVKPSKFHKPKGLETEFFTIIERVPELRKLLKHPVSKSFLYLKWHLVRKYYYINFIFYLIFCFMLSWHIFKIHQGTWSPFFSDLPTQSTSSANNDYTLHYGPSPSIIMILLGILVLRELSQFCVSPKSYIKSLENWMEMLVILTTGGLLAFVNETNADERSPISACAIVVSWMELTFLFGRYPTFSNYIEMFKMVAFNFFKYLSVYLLLIISFAFSFYILFKNQTQFPDTSLKNQTNAKNESTMEFWQDPKLSFLKSIIMLTGEFSAETIPLGTTFSTRHLFFILFIFLITIVLYNLLNGLAISDIQAIREDAELVALVSLVKLISQLELLAISSTFLYVSHIVSSCSLHFESWLCNISKLFSKVTMYPDTRIPVQPYGENLIGFAFSNSYPRPFWSNLKMPSSIVKQAMQILENRNEFDAVGDTADSLQVPAVKKHPLRFQSIDKLGQHLTAQIRDLEIKMHEKVTRKDEKLIQNVSKLMADFESKIDKIENLMESMIKEFKKQNE